MQSGQPSHTALGAATYRAIHQTVESGIIFSDPFASRILDDETRARLDEIAADASRRPMRLFVAARSRFSEDVLAACVARGVRQVVVLGAGLDTFRCATLTPRKASGYSRSIIRQRSSGSASVCTRRGWPYPARSPSHPSTSSGKAWRMV